jgi:hypothetical protein
MRIKSLLSLLALLSTLNFSAAHAWDPQPNNPFPGTAYNAPVPGYSKTITCAETPQIPDECVRQGGGQVVCPEWTANDITWTYRADGSVSSLISWCRNSWLPPTTQADDEDFRNRQQLAIAAATLESQNWNAANPGLQKCVTWGPIVHANGISTSSGGVCANVVGTLPDGSTKQVPPSPIGGSTAPTPVSDSSTTTAPTPAPVVDYSAYGIGKPFTKVIAKVSSTSGCPSGFQAASNELPGMSLTECWPSNAWSAWSVGGQTWQDFKSSNGSIDAQTAEAQRIQVTALRSLALQEAQRLANETIGIKRCSNWSGFGQSGQECAYIPVQNDALLGGSSGRVETATVQTVTDSNTAISVAGLSLADWQATETFTAFSCPSGYGKKTDINLNGTASTSDDQWIVSCALIPVLTETSTVVDTATALLPLSDTSTPILLQAQAIQFSGSTSEIARLSAALDLGDSESRAITKVIQQLDSLKSSSKLIKVMLPKSDLLTERAVSLTPSVCVISGLTVVPKKAGTCRITYGFEGESGNSFGTVKKVVFRK